MFKKYLPVILLTFVNIIGFSILIPVLPKISTEFAPARLNAVTYGVLLASYSFFQFVGAPILGSLSDKYGRRPILIVSQLGTTISWIIFGLAFFVPSYQFLGYRLPLYIVAFSRIIDGLTGGNISVANAWVSDLTDKKDKVKVFGLLGGVFGIGFLIGPALGGFTSSTPWGFVGTAVAAFFISIVTLVFLILFLPESLKEENKDKELDFHILDQLNVIKKINVFRDNVFIHRLLFIRLIFAFIFSSYTTAIILYLERSLRLETFYLGLAVSTIGIFAAFNQIFIVKKLAAIKGNLKTLYAGFVVVFIGLITLPLIPTSREDSVITYVLFFINSYILNLGVSFTMPSFKALFTNRTGPKKQGLITGLDESLIALGNGLSPIIAGLLYSIFGVYAFVIFAVVLGFTLLPDFRKWSSSKSKENKWPIPEFN